jgi:hypothetical protein
MLSAGLLPWLFVGLFICLRCASQAGARMAVGTTFTQPSDEYYHDATTGATYFYPNGGSTSLPIEVSGAGARAGRPQVDLDEDKTWAAAAATRAAPHTREGNMELDEVGRQRCAVDGAAKAWAAVARGRREDDAEPLTVLLGGDVRPPPPFFPPGPPFNLPRELLQMSPISAAIAGLQPWCFSNLAFLDQPCCNAQFSVQHYPPESSTANLAHPHRTIHPLEPYSPTCRFPCLSRHTLSRHTLSRFNL